MPPTDKAAKKAVPALRAYLDTVRSLGDRPVSIAAPREALESIIDDGRFKSQFESGTSRGLLDDRVRAEAERNLFGYPSDLPDEHRPIYGHISDRTLWPSSTATAYGDWNAVLDPRRTKDATFTIGDSLESETGACPRCVLDKDYHSRSEEHTSKLQSH